MHADRGPARSRELSRRTFLRAGAVGGAVALIPSLARAAGETLTFMTWGGDFGKGVRVAFSDPLEKKSGIKTRDVTPFSYGKFVAAMKSGNPEGYDLFWFNDEIEPLRAGTEGLLEKLNYDWLPNAKNVIPSVKQPYSVSPYITAYQAAYRSDLYKEPLRSWKDFFDVARFPGPRSFGTFVGGVLEAALMADGVEPDKLYPLDEARAYRSLNRLKPHIRVFHNTQQSEPVKQMLFQGEINMVLTWSTDFIRSKLDGKPVDVIYPQGFYFSPAVGIAKGTKNVRAAHEYLNILMDVDAQLAFTQAWTTSPSSPAAYERMPERERNAVVAGRIKEMVHLNPEYYAKNQADLQKRYDAWRVVS